MTQPPSPDPYGNRAERYSTGSEADSNAVEMLAIDNASRREQIRKLMLEASLQKLESQDIPARRKQYIEMKLAEVEWWSESSDHSDWQIKPDQQTALNYGLLCRQNINEAMEIFGRDVNRYNHYFISYIRNYVLYHPETPLTITQHEVVNRIFARDCQKNCLHIKNNRGDNFRCATCELLRLHSLLTFTPEYQEEQRQSNEEMWFLRSFN